MECLLMVSNRSGAPVKIGAVVPAIREALTVASDGSSPTGVEASIGGCPVTASEAGGRVRYGKADWVTAYKASITALYAATQTT